MNITLLRESFRLVTERSPRVIARFYEILFARHPDLANMFDRGPDGLAKQERMLKGALSAVLDHLEDGAWLERTLLPMGARHVKYGVRDEMYGWVGGSLLAALEEAAGTAWSPALAEAWSEAFGAIASLMLKGAQAVPTTYDARPGPHDDVTDEHGRRAPLGA